MKKELLFFLEKKKKKKEKKEKRKKRQQNFDIREISTFCEFKNSQNYLFCEFFINKKPFISNSK